MNCLIIFFSATGNTFYGAKLIKAGIESAGGTCDLVSTQEYQAEQMTGYDLLGFAAPVFAFQPALPLLDLISLLPAGGGQPCFTFLTRGGEGVNAHRILQQRLAAQGYPVIARREMLCEDSWTTIRFRGRLVGEDRPTQEEQDRVLYFGRSLVGDLEEFRSGGPGLPLPAFRYHPLHLVSYFYRTGFLSWSSPITVDPAKCDRCGICAARCPTGRLNPADFPAIQGPCTGCYACVNACPRDAIEGLLTRGRVRFRGIRDEDKMLG